MSLLIFFVDENILHLINWEAKVHDFIDHVRKEWDLHSIVVCLPSNVLATSPLEDRFFGVSPKMVDLPLNPQLGQ